MLYALVRFWLGARLFCPYQNHVSLQERKSLEKTRGGVGESVSLICTKKINTYKTATLGSFTYVHSDLEFNELSSGSSSIITASVIILVVGFP